MECVIRVIDGPDRGLVHSLAPGETLIGRGERADLRLTAADVSYEHAVITRDGDEYIIQNLSANGTFIDGAKVNGQTRVRPNDRLTLSPQTVLRLERAEGGGGLAASKGLLWSLVAVLVVAACVVLIWNPLRSDPPVDDWNRAYHYISDWTTREASARRLPAETPGTFADAWRADQARDYARSQKAWVKMQLILESVEDRRRLAELSSSHPDALQTMLNAQTEPSSSDNQQLAAALMQFVKRRLAWSVKQIAASSTGIR